MLRGRAVISGCVPSGGIQQDLQQDPRGSWREARWPVGDDYPNAAGVVRDSGVVAADAESAHAIEELLLSELPMRVRVSLTESGLRFADGQHAGAASPIPPPRLP
jgi:hypothetical protein